MLSTWISKNASTIMISVMTVAGTFTLYGYRIDILEKKVEVLERESISNQVLLAEIKKDIEYIKIQVGKINP